MNASRHRLRAGLGYAALGLFFSSCGGGHALLEREALAPMDSTSDVKYSVVFVIHGDGDYLYHDQEGRALQADEEALAKAVKAARENPQAEVFIFHQKPRRHTLLFFPRRDGEFFYYRKGELRAQEKYWRDGSERPLGPETTLFQQWRARPSAEAAGGRQSVFFYCGHEIPEQGGAGYDESYPDRPFSVSGLAAGMRGFMEAEASKFDIVILATCFGGTPRTIGTLAPLARTMIASPDFLHLSYFNPELLMHLERSMQPGDRSGTFAKEFARGAFRQLTQDVQTVVSVGVYDADSVQEYVRAVRPLYDEALEAAAEKTEASGAGSSDEAAHCDCAEVPAYVMPSMRAGVEILYRAPRFGRSAQTQTHSGWECRKPQ